MDKIELGVFQKYPISLLLNNGTDFSTVLISGRDYLKGMHMWPEPEAPGLCNCTSPAINYVVQNCETGHNH